MIKRKEYPVYGRWKVTTEGDVEGRTITDLGYWDGYIDEIALHLAHESYYSLTFSLVDPQPSTLSPTMPEVSVVLDINSGTWDMKPDDRINYLREMFKDRPVFIEHSNYFASFKIKTQRTVSEEDIEKAKAKQKLLNSLSEEELDLLGIKV